MCKMLFPDRPYVSLEAPEDRAYATEDPRGFLERFGAGVVIDEVQRAPELLSYIQVYADEQQQPGMYILTGSQNLLLLDRIAQSLAGRTALVTLLPFSMVEAYGHEPPASPEQILYTGFYPRIFDRGLNPTEVKALMGLLREIVKEGITIFLIEHVMQAIMNVSDRIAVLHHGEKIAEGAPHAIASDERVIQAYLGEEFCIA